jgi:hypothetical protein
LGRLAETRQAKKNLGNLFFENKLRFGHLSYRSFDFRLIDTFQPFDKLGILKILPIVVQSADYHKNKQKSLLLL